MRDTEGVRVHFKKSVPWVYLSSSDLNVSQLNEKRTERKLLDCNCTPWLNMELDLQSLFGLHGHSLAGAIGQPRQTTSLCDPMLYT
jgi:hypothetical protein